MMRLEPDSPEYKNLKHKMNKLQQNEKNLNENLLASMQRDNMNPHLEKAISQLQEENKYLNESLKRAEDHQTPEYHKFKDKLDKLAQENKYLRSRISNQIPKESEPVRRALKKIEAEKENLLDELQNVDVNSEEYDKLNEKIDRLKNRENQLTNELLKAQEKSSDILLNKAIENLQKENKQLEEDLKRAEDTQTPDFQKFKQKINSLQYENKNLKEALDLNKNRPLTLPIRKELESLNEEKDNLIENLKNANFGDRNYEKLNEKIADIENKEKSLNEKLLNTQGFKEDPLIKKAIEQIQNENKKLEENLIKAEDKQTPDYHKFKKVNENLERENR